MPTPRIRPGRITPLLLALIAALATLPGVAAATDTAGLLRQAAEHVRQRAEETYPGAEVSVRMVPLDPRLRLQACEDLRLDSRRGRAAGRLAVQARCLAPKAWALYLTAQVDVRLPIVVVARPVPRQAVLQARDLTLETRNLGDLRDGYLTEIADAVGLAARSNLRVEQVLYQRQLEAARLVNRGDTVTLASRHGHVSVTTQAVALTDGAYGEQVEVRNPRSDRVITGWVTGPGTVAVNP